MTKEDKTRLNNRFIKDYNLKINKDVADDEIFIPRLMQYEKYKNGVIEKYKTFVRELEQYRNMDEYYIERNEFISKIITDQEQLQKQYNLFGNPLTEYKIENLQINSGNVYSDNHLGKILVSIDLKEASFQALKFYNPKIVRDAETYDDYIKNFTDKKIFNSKRIRSSAFGKTGNKQIYKIERFLTRDIVDFVLKYENTDKIKVFNADEVVFERTENLQNILDDVSALQKRLNLRLTKEEFTMDKIYGTDGYIKNITDLDSGDKKVDIVGINTLEMPFVLASLLGEKIEDSFLYFRINDLLCKLIEVPNIEIIRAKEMKLEK